MVSKQRILRIWFRFESKCNRFLLKYVLALWCNSMLISGISLLYAWKIYGLKQIIIFVLAKPTDTELTLWNIIHNNWPPICSPLLFFMLSPSDVSWHNTKRYQSGKYRGEYEFIIIKMYWYFIKYKFNHLLSSSFWFRRQEE